MRISHVLVATDLSPTSRGSYEHAVAIARVFGARITLLNVDELAEIGFRSSAAMLDYMERVSTVREQRLAEAEAIFDTADQPATVVELPGHPGLEIGRFARENEVDLIVLARHGDHATGPLGSTSQRVVISSPVPVLVVHDPKAAVSVPGERLTIPRYDRILAGTDFGLDSTRALHVVRGLAELCRAEALVAHVWRNPGAAIPVRDDQLPDFPAELMAELQRNYEARFRSWLFDAGHPEAEHLVVPGHSAAVGLIAAGLEWGAKMIVVPSHGKRTLEAMLITGTVLRLLTLSPLPVLVLPHQWLSGYASRVGTGEIPPELPLDAD